MKEIIMIGKRSTLFWIVITKLTITLYGTTDSFVKSIKTKDIIGESITFDLFNLKDLFDFSSLNGESLLEFYSVMKIKNCSMENLKLHQKTPKNIWIDEFICLRQ